MLSRFSRVQLFATLWTITCEASLSMGPSRQEKASTNTEDKDPRDNIWKVHAPEKVRFFLEILFNTISFGILIYFFQFYM